MFKNAIFYRLPASMALDAATISAALEPRIHQPCTPNQERSVGWVAPRGPLSGDLVESIAGNLILRLTVETRSVPADAIARLVQSQSSDIERSTGSKPGKKELAEIKEQAKAKLLASAFSKVSTALVCICRADRLLVVEASSHAKADDVVHALMQAIQGCLPTPIQTQASPAAAMSAWLLNQDAPAGFSVDRECELKSSDESKAVVRYNNHALDIEEVQQHIRYGKVPTRLAMTWNGRISFVLTDTLVIKKLAFWGNVLEADLNEKPADRFDADVAIFGGEIVQFLPQLLEALGGAAEIELEAANV